MTKQEKIHLKTIMWRVLQARVVVTYDDLQELSGVSRAYAQEWVAMLVKRDVVEKLSNGRFRLIDDSAVMDFSPSPPVRKTCRMKMQPGKYKLTYDELAAQPESILWQEIRNRTVFIASDLVKLKITSKTGVYQYLALLVRAGFLKKERANTISNQCNYVLIKNTGDAAPVVGRAWFLFDPNSGETWDDIPERESLKTVQSK